MRAAMWLAVSLAVACGGTDGPGGPGTGGGPPPPPVATNAVDVIDNRFDPQGAAVTRGTAVTWTWRGTAQHNVTFEDGQGSSTTKTSGTHQRAFGSGGTFRYRCTIHSANFESGMVGSVVVN